MEHDDKIECVATVDIFGFLPETVGSLGGLEDVCVVLEAVRREFGCYIFI